MNFSLVHQGKDKRYSTNSTKNNTALSQHRVPKTRKRRRMTKRSRKINR